MRSRWLRLSRYWVADSKHGLVECEFVSTSLESVYDICCFSFLSMTSVLASLMFQIIHDGLPRVYCKMPETVT